MSQPVASARLVAAHAIVKVLTKQMPLETALAGQATHGLLSGRDRAFARLIAATTFRRLGQIDGALKPFIKQTPPGIVHAMLRTGVAQMLYLDTPPHAAVGETVATLKQSAHTRGFAGMANAILRRISEQGGALSARIAPQENVPRWLRKSWERDYGKSAMRKMARTLLFDPSLDISVKSDPELWAEKLGGKVLPTGTIRLPKIGDVTALAGFDAGAWWAQDLASSLPVKLMGDVRGKRVLDMCAAPGGKTLQLAAAGAHVTALDRSASRLERVTENLARVQLEAEIIAVDALDYAPEQADFDIILLDAPCTATGTYRRHPDVLYNKQPKDIAALTRIQDALLEKATSLLAPDGLLVYCTCSLQSEEGEDRMTRLLGELPEFRLIPVLEDEISGLEVCISTSGYLRSCPYFLEDQGGLDGFFIARLQRKETNL